MAEESFERRNATFILSFWLEEVEGMAHTSGPLWRGYITHVMSGQRACFQGLDMVKTILETYLNQTVERD